MKNSVVCRTLVFLILGAVIPALPAAAQAPGQNTNPALLVSTSFDMTGFPQWAKDMRRWEVVAFGSFPFTMLFTTMAVDSYRWSNNGWDRRYAPWPLKSAGAVNMTNSEREMTLAIAAGISAAIAIADFIIVQVKRQKARRRAEALPVGTTIIIKKPWPEDPPAGAGEAAPP